MPGGAIKSLKVMTVNTHKGFTALNRKFILPELRDAVRTVGADVVFLQEVLGTHSRHQRKVDNWPEAPHYEFLADTMWPQFAYGRNAVYPKGHHGNAVLSKYPIVSFTNHDVSVAGPEKRGLLHCVLRLPGRPIEVHVICAHLGLAEAHRAQQLELLCQIVQGEVPPDSPLKNGMADLKGQKVLGRPAVFGTTIGSTPHLGILIAAKVLGLEEGKD